MALVIILGGAVLSVFELWFEGFMCSAVYKVSMWETIPHIWFLG